MFDPTSRYAGLQDLTFEDSDGTSIRYRARRVVPLPPEPGTLPVVSVTEGARLDLLAARRLGASTRFWMVADANAEADPFALTSEVGRQIQVPGLGQKPPETP